MAVATTTSISPTKSLLAGGTVVTATGVGYTGTTGVTVGGTAATAVTVVNDTTLHFTTPTKTAGSYAIVVTNGTGPSTVNVNIAYEAVPTVTAISPTTGGLGGDDEITLTGTGFTDATAVKLGSSPVTYEIVNGTTILAHTIAGTGTANFTVTGPGGVSPTASGNLFTYASTTTESYNQPDGDEEFNQFFMDIDLSPASLASGQLYKRLDPWVYPEVGGIQARKQGVAGSPFTAPAPANNQLD